MPETEQSSDRKFELGPGGLFHRGPIPPLDARGAARRLREQARNLPASRLDYAAELVRTAEELEQSADAKERLERIAAAGVQA